MNKIVGWFILRKLKKVEKNLERKNMEGKSFLKSKTLWANVLAVILIIAQEIGGVTPAALDAGSQSIILAVVNIILRTITKQPVNLKGK